MLLRIKKRKKRFLFCANSKKAISTLIGYVLLVSFVIIMGTIVYQVLETYVPKDVVECPEGISVFVKESSCLDKGGGTFKLNLTLKNNGRFDIDGYFIHATKVGGQELATWNISGYFEGESSTKGGLITFKKEYPLEPSQEIENIFNLDYRIYSVEILPIRFQPGFVSCWEAKVSETINCGAGGEECVSKTCITLDKQCGTWSDGCIGTLDCDTEIGCEGTELCDLEGQCVPPETCEDTCENSAAECGSVCGTVCTDTCDPLTETCIGTTCTSVSYCGDGVIQTPNFYEESEECDDGGTESGDGCSSVCLIETGWSCVGTPSVCNYCNLNEACDAGEDCSCSDCELDSDVCGEGNICIEGTCESLEGTFNSCGDYCFIFGYSTIYACQDNSQKCAPPQGPEGGVYIGNVPGADETFGNSLCLADPKCCCVP